MYAILFDNYFLTEQLFLHVHVAQCHHTKSDISGFKNGPCT